MFEIEYGYTVGETIWITDDNEEVYDAFIVKVVLEIDHDEEQNIIEKKTYHLFIRELPHNIVLKPESEIFGTAGDAVKFLNDPELLAPELNTHTETYDYTIGDVVWIITDAIAVQCTNTQTTLNIIDTGNQTLVERIYHLLPEGDKSSVILKDSSDIYDSKEDAIQAIKDRLISS